MDIFWIITMQSVWGSKPFNNHTSWAVFDFLRGFTMIASIVNVVVKVFIIIGLFFIYRKG